MNIYFLSGLGFSNPVFNKYTWKTLDYFSLFSLPFKSMIASLEKQIIGPAVLIAWSLGGLLAIKLAQLLPQKINKIILCGSQPKFLNDDNWQGIAEDDFEYIKNLSQENYPEFQKYFLRLVHYPLSKKIVTMDASKCQIIPLLNLLKNLDLRAEYSQLSCEIIHIMGDRDAVLPQCDKQLTQLNKNSKMIRITNAGHLAFLTHFSLWQKEI